MTIRPWKKISETLMLSNPWWEYRKDETILPSGRNGEYHYVHTEGSSMVIPRLGDGRILMVEQYRYLAMRTSIEFPCGSVKGGAGFDTTARLELKEETGYEAGVMVPAGEFNPYNGVTDEICRVYLAENLVFTGGIPDETEEFELVPLMPEEIGLHIRNGTIWDGMSIAGWHLVTSKDLLK